MLEVLPQPKMFSMDMDLAELSDLRWRWLMACCSWVRSPSEVEDDAKVLHAPAASVSHLERKASMHLST